MKIIRTIYLYLFALLGLVLLVIGGVRLVDLGLKMTVFRQADSDFLGQPTLPLCPSMTEQDFLSSIEKCEEKCELPEGEKASLQNWLADYEAWKKSYSENNFKTQQRQKQASQSFAFLLIGFPLYFFHWRIIRREAKKA